MKDQHQYLAEVNRELLFRSDYVSIASAILTSATLCIITCLSVGLVFAYRQGLKDRQAIDKGESLKPVVEPKPREKTPEEIEREQEEKNLAEDFKAWRG